MRELVLLAMILVHSGFVRCQSANSLDLDDGLKQFQDKFPDIANNPDLQSRLNNTKLPNLEDVQKVMKEKCEKEGHPDAVDSLSDQQELARACVERYLNFTIIQEELDKASETGSMDEVFTKYCNLWPEIYACFDNATDLVRQCMNDQEEEAFNKTLGIIVELKEFMCFKDGDRLAMFVAEGGVECMKERKDGIALCLNDTLGSRIPDSNDFSITNMPMFLYSSKDCEDFEKIRTCVVHDLEKCKDSTPANIVDAFFKFLRKHMPCKSEETPAAKSSIAAKENSNSKASNTQVISVSVILVALCLFFKF